VIIVLIVRYVRSIRLHCDAHADVYMCLIFYDCSNFVSCSDLNCVPLSEIIASEHSWQRITFSVMAYVMAATVAWRSGCSSTHFENWYYMLSNQE